MIHYGVMKRKNILILGGDGYLGWPTAMRLAATGHKVSTIDNFAKRKWELEVGVKSLIPIPLMQDRLAAFHKVTGKAINFIEGDITYYSFLRRVIGEIKPDTIIHYGEQPSAPYSMIDRDRAAYTQINNIVGTMNVLFAMKKHVPDCHLVKLGTMGEYGTPNIDIEEGFITIEKGGRSDTLPFPKQAGSFYHLSKVHDSHNIHFVCRTWGLKATDLNQGVVYGIETDETKLAPELVTSFHYDAIFGTALNRFCTQAVVGEPLTVYGKGGQKRGFLNIRDTLACVELAVLNPPKSGEYRVFNQFTEVFSVLELAKLVAKQAEKLKMKAKIKHIDNPRKEAESHYYNPKHRKLIELGLRPTLLSKELIGSMLTTISKYRDNVDKTKLPPEIKWRY